MHRKTTNEVGRHSQSEPLTGNISSEGSNGAQEVTQFAASHFHACCTTINTAFSVVR